MRKLVFLLVAGWALPALAQFSISQLPAASLPLQSTDAMIVNQTINGAHTTRQAALSSFPSFFSVGGNPTALVGLTPVNGAALTLMRSDGAPALSQAIVPTWTGTHLFEGPISSAVGASAFSPGVVTGFPAFTLANSGGVADSKLWRNYADTSNYFSQISNDAASVFKSWLQVSRTANVISSMQLGNAGDNPSILFSGTSTFTPSAGVAVTINDTSANPSVINGANTTTGGALSVNGQFTGAGTVGLMTLSDAGNTNGINIKMIGNGGATPNKTIRVIGGLWELMNSGYSAALMTVSDAGGVQIGTPTGGDKGAGTLNAGGLFLAGNAVLSTGAAVTPAQGGTGVATLPIHAIIVGGATGPVSSVPAMALDTLVQGQGVTVDPAAVSVPNCGSTSTALSYSTGTHTFGCQTISTGLTLANPTALIGLTAVNGAAITGIRSDGAPALDQSISPTWTGTHTFSGPSLSYLANGIFTHDGASAAAGVVQSIFRNSTATGDSSVRLYNDQNVGARALEIDYAGSTYATTLVTGGPTGEQGAISTTGAFPLTLGTSGIARETVTSVGNWTINAPSSGDTVSVSGLSASSVLALNAAAGQQFTTESWKNNSVTEAQAYWDNTNSNFNIGATVAASTNILAGGSARITITSAGAIGLPSIASTSAAQTGTVCWSSTGGNLTVDTTLACLSSTARVKEHIKPLDIGLSQVLKLRPVSYDLKPKFNPKKLGPQVGLVAEEVEKIDPRLVALDDKGVPLGVRYMQLTAVLVKAIQEQQAEIDTLKKSRVRRH